MAPALGDKGIMDRIHSARFSSDFCSSLSVSDDTCCSISRNSFKIDVIAVRELP
jgi:hypothetical protein